MIPSLSTLTPTSLATRLGLSSGAPTQVTAKPKPKNTNISKPSRPAQSSSSVAVGPAPTPFPFAAAPDIIRAHQKDTYFTAHLTTHLSTLHRLLLGPRSAHTWTTEHKTLSSLLYLTLTTILGNRTLGEEYCDVFTLTGSDGKLPSVKRRTAYVFSAVLVPYGLGRLLPKLRAHLRPRMVEMLAKMDPRTLKARFLRYIILHLPTLLSTSPSHLVTLALFYFTGTYYELAKRVTNLRYIFPHKQPSGPGTDRGGYEVLGGLLAFQILVTVILHARQILTGKTDDTDAEYNLDSEVELLRLPARTPDLTDILLGTAPPAPPPVVVTPPSTGSKVDLAAVTNTPVMTRAHYDLEDDGVMGFIVGMQQRKCTLCLEGLKDPAVTPCGHVFCWGCIGDWVREKPECPLCRREAMVQHVLPLRTV